MMQRKQLERLHISDFEGTINEVITKLRALEFRAKADGYLDIEFEEYDSGYNESSFLTVYGLRHETPEEAKKREENEVREKERKIRDAKFAISRNREYLKSLGVEE